MTVAVKTLASAEKSAESIGFIEEMKLMADLKYNINIVKYIGQVTIKQPMMIVMEHCANGNLRDYLRKVCSCSVYIIYTDDCIHRPATVRA